MNIWALRWRGSMRLSSGELTKVKLKAEKLALVRELNGIMSSQWAST